MKGAPEKTALLDAPWSVATSAVASALDVDIRAGVDANDVGRRRRSFGSNALPSHDTERVLKLLLRQIVSPLIVLLTFAGLAALLTARGVEAVSILVVVVVSVAIGFLMEWRAVRSVDALRRAHASTATVRRSGVPEEVAHTALVVGDVLILGAGDVIAADARIIECSKLFVNEAALTGESVPVAKRDATLDERATLFERANMLFRGTAITRGTAEAIVVATGVRTELGRLAAPSEPGRRRASGLHLKLERLGRQLMALAGACAALAIGLGLATRLPFAEVVEMAIVLAVATVPEGLPVVATLALARAMWRMANRRVAVERLDAVERLGETSILLTDKTGTLTEDELSVSAFDEPEPGGMPNPSGEPIASLALRSTMLFSADVDGEGEAMRGDPIDRALVRFALHGPGSAERAIDPRAFEVLREEAFDPSLRLMANIVRAGGETFIACKGAPEAVLEACQSVHTPTGDEPLSESLREAWREAAASFAGRGLRAIGLARRTLDAGASEELTGGDVYDRLVWVGIVGLDDPPRAGVREALSRCREAGIRTIMLTGDHPEVARAVARSVGIDVSRGVLVGGSAFDRSVNVYARMTPDDKLRVLEAHRERGAIVSMIGDGVNDAPALRLAEVGVAMGRRGTQVARRAADIVLLDDDLAAIPSAVQEGRIAYLNIQNFVRYLVSCNLSEILVVLIGTLVWLDTIVTPMQLLFLNLLTDVFPALALGVERGDASVLRDRPRNPTDPILPIDLWALVLVDALVMAAVVGLAFALARREPDVTPEGASSVAFVVLALAQLAHVAHCRVPRRRDAAGQLLPRGRNPWLLAAVAFCAIIIAIAFMLELARRVMGLDVAFLVHHPWLLAVAFSSFLLVPSARKLTLLALGKNRGHRA